MKLGLMAVLLLCLPDQPSAQLLPTQQQIVAEIHKLGGSVKIDKKDPAKPVIGVYLQFLGPKVTGTALEQLKGLTQLRELYLFTPRSPTLG